MDVAKGTLSLVTWAQHLAALPGVGLLGLLFQQLQLAAEGHGHTAARHSSDGKKKMRFLNFFNRKNARENNFLNTVLFSFSRGQFDVCAWGLFGGG